MAGETDDPAEAALRLETALERIAQVAQRDPVAAVAAPDPTVAALADRLDTLIVRLRAALAASVP